MPGTITQGTELDRYVVESILGEGGMATVYRVRHRDLATPYALKLLKLRVRSLADRLLQEGKIQAALQHPNIVAVTDVLRLDDDIGLVMEYVDGIPLDLLLVNHQLSHEEVDAIALDLFDGIEAAHEQRLVHRDLKPANVMLAIHKNHLQAKVADFGLAKAVKDELSVGRATKSGAVMGTPSFMAPEQHRDAKAVDGRADLFSLGLILYEVVTGIPAIEGDALPDILQQVMSESYRPIEELVPMAPERWSRAIMACIRADRELRPPDVAALRALWNAPRRPSRWSEETMAATRHIQANAPPPPELPPPDIGHVATRVPQPPAQHATGATVAAPATPVPAPTRLPSRGLMASAAALSVGVVGLGVLAVITAVAAWFLYPWEAEVELPPVAAVEAPRPEPEPTVPPTEPEPEPTAQPTEPAPEPAPVAAPAPVEPRPTPVPVAAPAPAPSPAPQPVEPAPVAAPEPAPIETPSVVIGNGSWRAYLKKPGGSDTVDLADAAPGTYELWVLFDMQRPDKAGTVTVTAGTTAKVRCEELSRGCIQVSP